MYMYICVYVILEEFFPETIFTNIIHMNRISFLTFCFVSCPYSRDLLVWGKSRLENHLYVPNVRIVKFKSLFFMHCLPLVI
jgi:hypothetical protein